jgi:hypothetical protein
MSLLNSASLVVTPNGYKEGTLYSVIPNTTLGDMTVVRATTATRVNSAGLIELVPYNLLQRSEDFSNGYWSKVRSSLTTNTTTAPDGTLTADKLIPNTDADTHFARGIVTATTNGVVLSCFVKLDGSASDKVTLYPGGAATFANYNLSTLTVSNEANVLSSQIIDYGDGWYRLVSTYPPGLNYDNVRIYNSSGIIGAHPTAGNGVDGIYIWGAQLVKGTLPKDYLRTETRLNIPRLDYSNGTCPSLLVEPQRTNLITYSEDYAQSDWSKLNAGTGTAPIITSNYAISPDGTLNASRIVLDKGSGTTSGDYSAISDVITLSGDGSFSIYLKSNTGTNYIVSQRLENVRQQITITSEWQRFVFSASSLVNGTSALWLRGGYGSDDYADLLVWAAQTENASYPTSYIPTSGSTVTRNADAISKTGISSLINSTEGVLYAEISALANDLTYKRISIGTSDNLFADNVGLRFNDTGTSVTYQFRVGNVYQAELTSTINQTDVNKLACVWKVNRFELWLNGVKVAEDTSGSVPSANTLNSVFYGKTSTTLAEPLYSNTKSLIVFPSALSDTELAQLTTI